MSYYLKKPPNKDGSALIYLQKNYHAIRLIISTGLNIKPEFWDKRTERVKRQFRYAKEYNAILDKYEDVTERSYLEMWINGVPSKEALKAEVLRRMDVTGPATVHSFALVYIHNNPQWDLKTKQGYKRVADLINEFNPKLTFDMITAQTMADFVAFMFAKKWVPETVAKRYERFKTICSAAYRDGVTKNDVFNTDLVKVEKRGSTQIFLDELELDAMWRVKVTGPEEIARDRFLIAAWSAVRYSDIGKINKTTFYKEAGESYFKVLTKKGAQEVLIPAHPVVISIMKKYDWHLPEMINSEMNDLIKIVAQKAGITRDVVHTSFPGNVRKDEVLPKYKLVSTHTGRRSLICNMILAGVPIDTIRSVSGHTSDAIKKYILLTPSDQLRIAFKTKFFSAKLKSV